MSGGNAATKPFKLASISACVRASGVGIRMQRPVPGAGLAPTRTQSIHAAKEGGDGAQTGAGRDASHDRSARSGADQPRRARMQGLLTALSGRVWSHLRSRRRRRPRQTIPLAPRTAATAPTRCSSACAGWRRCPLAQHACARTIGYRELVLSAEVIELNIFAPSNTAAALTGSMIARACCVSLPRGRGRKRSGRVGGAGGGDGRSREKD